MICMCWTKQNIWDVDYRKPCNKTTYCNLVHTIAYANLNGMVSVLNSGIIVGTCIEKKLRRGGHSVE
jgi:hypothetical protein